MIALYLRHLFVMSAFILLSEYKTVLFYTRSVLLGRKVRWIDNIELNREKRCMPD
jgi:hypothetical protein